MQKWVIPVLCVITVLFLLMMMYTNSSVTTVKYFPIDEEAIFTDAETGFSALEETPPTFAWSTTSTSSESMYLRQDIGLLFENGLFKGIQSKWQQNEQTISQSQSFMPKKAAYLQALTFHHGELHHEKDTITSIQKLTTAEGYILKIKQAFTFAQNPEEQSNVKQLREITENNVQKNKQALMDYFAIQQSEYDVYTLMELAQFEDTSLLNFSKEETERIIGRLWEGLYKNYVLPLKEKENKTFQHAMPLILVAKDGSHLFVLFELHDGKKQLIQQLPNS